MPFPPTAFYCCTCAVPCPAPSLEKPAGAGAGSSMPPSPRQLPCCDRIVCGSCLTTNPRFATYCPYCQIATAPPPPPPIRPFSSNHIFEKAVNASPSSSSSSSSYYSSANRQPSQNLLPPGLKPPPPYRPRTGPPPPPTNADDDDDTAPPPPYSIHGPATAPEDKFENLTANKDKAAAFPLLHYLDHDRDTVASLCLRYGVSADALRRANRLTSNHLLLARRVVQIPAREDRSSASPRPLPISLSPYPVEGAAEARRKAAIRRFMVACKVADYDLAVLYLEQTATTTTGAAGDDGADDADDDDGGPNYDLSAAMAAYTADEAWERAHPLAAAMSKTNKATTATAKHAGAQRQRTLGGGLFAHAAARVRRRQQQRPPQDGAVS
ncbi:hypothetical protein SPI_06733 [Niveomyces insectorum RCEF 264]|uniref:LysM domain-containing protein n=1 Tax=Niveomyces insectorum RCEF 264 TaxID=1081102 RepID=A0A167QQD3_9HYPO|nr:hypothetical protein SPI_06733 [Niveomyces insectorum RCEF 264]